MKTSVSQSIEAGKQTPQEFAKTHWKEILAVSVTLAGAAIFLLVEYHKKRKKGEGEEDQNVDLDLIAADAQLSERHPTAVMLDLVPDLHVHIPDAALLAEQLAEGLPEEIESEVLEKKRKRRWFKGSPKETMQTIGKIK